MATTNRRIIAVVQLQSGQGGYFDPVSRVHLTTGNSTATIYAGMNLTNIRTAVKSGRLKVVSGSLGEAPPPFKLERQGNRFFLVPNKNDKTTPKAATKKKDVKAQRAEALKAKTVQPEEVPLTAEETVKAIIPNADEIIDHIDEGNVISKEEIAALTGPLTEPEEPKATTDEVLTDTDVDNLKKVAEEPLTEETANAVEEFFGDAPEGQEESTQKKNKKRHKR